MKLRLQQNEARSWLLMQSRKLQVALKKISVIKIANIFYEEKRLNKKCYLQWCLMFLVAFEVIVWHFHLAISRRLLQQMSDEKLDRKVPEKYNLWVIPEPEPLNLQ